MDQQETYEYIEAYLDKKLSDTEVHAFEVQLRDDPDFAAAVALHRQLHVEYAPSKINTFRDMMREEATAKPAVIIRRMPMRKVFSVAASVAIIVVAGLFYFSNRTIDPNQLYAQYADHPTLSFDATQRGADTTNTDALVAVMNQASGLYQDQQYTAAIQTLTTLNPATYVGYGDAINLRLAIYHLSNDEAESAIPYFDQIDDLTEAVRWYKSLALLKLGRTDEVRTLLSPLTTFDNPKRDAATRILNRME